MLMFNVDCLAYCTFLFSWRGVLYRSTTTPPELTNCEDLVILERDIVGVLTCTSQFLFVSLCCHLYLQQIVSDATYHYYNLLIEKVKTPIIPLIYNGMASQMASSGGDLNYR